MLLEKILRNILNQVDLQCRLERQAIIRRYISCDCIQFPYELGIGNYSRPVIRYRMERNLRIFFTTSLMNLEREAVLIMQAIVLAKAA